MVLKEKFEEFKREFFKAAKNAVSNAIKNKVINEDKIKLPPKTCGGRGQYAGFIYYYKVTFKEPVKIKNGKDGKDVKVIEGFHIMPYRINAEDMKKAEKQSKKKDFNKRVTDKNHKDDNSQLVDYDEGSGNFHKVPDGEFQVVLLDENANPDGPGPNTYENRSKNKDMYFPRPDSKNVHKGNDLEQFIKEAMKYLKENEMKMLVEIFYKQELYSRVKIDFASKTLEVIEEPNREIRFVDSIFEYSDGFRFDFKSVSTFLKNRSIDENTPEGVYWNVDSGIRIVVIRPERLGK